MKHCFKCGFGKRPHKDRDVGVEKHLAPMQAEKKTPHTHKIRHRVAEAKGRSYQAGREAGKTSPF